MFIHSILRTYSYAIGYFHFIRNNIFLLLNNAFVCDNHPPAGVACHSILGWLSHAMIHLVDDGYHIVRLSGPVIILFSNSNSFYMDMLCIF